MKIQFCTQILFTLLIFSSTLWAKQNDEYIKFTQYILKNHSTIDTEDSDCTIIYIDDVKIAYFEKFEKKTYFWNTEEYAFSLTTTSSITNNDVIELIKSLKNILLE